MALAIMVSTRLWLGGMISVHRDKGLIQALADQLRLSRVITGMGCGFIAPSLTVGGYLGASIFGLEQP